MAGASPADERARVAIARASEGVEYSEQPPYHPSHAYPEYPFPAHVGARPNPGYEGVREALHLLGYDSERWDSPEWNPLAELIRPGDRVVLKPNMVRDFHEDRAAGTTALVTHGSIVRAVVDYVYLAQGGKGELVIADSPQNDADWDGLCRAFRFDELLAFYRDAAPDFELRIVDVRKEAVRKRHGVVVHRYTRPGDPFGYSRIDLADNSEFAEVPERTGKLYGAEYDISQTEEHHRPGRHEYLVANTFLQADVIINVPKWKTHKKSGLTVWIKSAIGICGDKNWLPHHTEGTPAQGGDQFAEDSIKRKTEQRVVLVTKRALRNAGPVGGYVGSGLRKLGSYVFGDTNRDAIRSGNWYGNDTIWRTVWDLHKCWIYADRHGRLQPTPQRRFLCIVDGIVAGEGNGPLGPDPKPLGLVLAGRDAVTVDTVCAVLMGFDPDRLRVLARAPFVRGFDVSPVPRGAIECASSVEAWSGPLAGISDTPDFKPHFGWADHVEQNGRPDVEQSLTAAGR